MSYSWKTFGSSKTDLLGRLGDSTFWTSTEVGFYLIESLRTYNLVAQFYHDRFFFNTQAGFCYYDLTQNTNPSSLVAGIGANSSYLGYTITDRNMVNQIQYHLMEPQTSIWPTWNGSEQFTMDDVVRAIERRRNQYLSLVSSHVTRSQYPYGPPPGTGRITIDDSVIDIHRGAWLDLDLQYTPLYKEDEYNASTLLAGWETTPSTPTMFSTILSPPKGLQLIPLSKDLGTVDILTINNPSNLDVSTGVLLNIPDDHSWIIKWGALADLLGRDSQAYDPVRSKYCEQRFEHGIQLAIADSCIYQALINNSIIQAQSLNDFDSYNYNWQNETGIPTELAIISRNLIALTPTPQDSGTSIALNVLRNVPIPSSDGDFLQISREAYDLLLDYAYHLAMFKCQGTEFQGSFPMLDRFMQSGLLNNSKLSESANSYSIMKELSSKELMEDRRITSREDSNDG